MAILVKNSHITSYFSSVSTLNRKFIEESDELRNDDNWDKLSLKEKEGVIDRLFISDSYDNDYDESESPFPDLKVRCGEKIVVDFENEDGWTWRDEHSGPFSWMTKSQQDLTLDEIYQDSQNSKEKKVQQKIKPGTNEQEPYFKVPDEQPYTTSLTNEMSEIEAAFQKFGINVQADEELLPTAYLESGDYNDIDISFDSAKDSGNDSRSEDNFKGHVHDSPVNAIREETKDWSTSSESSPEHVSTKTSRISLNSILKWPWGKKKHADKSETAFMSLPLASPSNQSKIRDLEGHVSPVFENDETITVITNQPQSVLETYDNVPTVTERNSQSFDHLESSATYEIYNSASLSMPKSEFNQSESHTEYNESNLSADFNQSLPSDHIVSSFNASTPAKSYDYNEDENLTDSIKIEESSMYIEPRGESTDYRASLTENTDTVDTEDTSAQDDSFISASKTGFDFLDNW